jgi:uncharacterized protein YcfJ
MTSLNHHGASFKRPCEQENTMSNALHHPALRRIVAALVAASSLPAMAGPAVGSVVGTPSSTTVTVDAKVISATPVVAQVATPRQVCFDELRQEPARSSGAGAIIGAIAGAAVGNAVGRGSGKALATGVGLIGGAVLGDRIENDGRTGTSRTVQRCEQQSSYENRVVAYSVVYEVGGQRYTTQMNSEPGRTIPVQMTVTPAVSSQVMAPVAAAPVIVTPEPVRYVSRYERDVVVVPAPTVIETRYERPRHEGWHHRHHREWD